MLSDLSRGIDWLRLSYRAEAPFYLNAAIAYDAHWRAAWGARPATVVRGNFGGLVVAVPAGSGTIEFRYVNRASELFFASADPHGAGRSLAAAWLTCDILDCGLRAADNGGRSSKTARDRPCGTDHDRDRPPS